MGVSATKLSAEHWSISEISPAPPLQLLPYLLYPSFSPKPLSFVACFPLHHDPSVVWLLQLRTENCVLSRLPSRKHIPTPDNSASVGAPPSIPPPLQPMLLNTAEHLLCPHSSAFPFFNMLLPGKLTNIVAWIQKNKQKQSGPWHQI